MPCTIKTRIPIGIIRILRWLIHVPGWNAIPLQLESFADEWYLGWILWINNRCPLRSWYLIIGYLSPKECPRLRVDFGLCWTYYTDGSVYTGHDASGKFWRIIFSTFGYNDKSNPQTLGLLSEMRLLDCRLFPLRIDWYPFDRCLKRGRLNNEAVLFPDFSLTCSRFSYS